MRKRLTILAVIWVLAIPAVAAQNHQFSKKDATDTQSVAPPTCSVTNNDATTNYQQSSDGKPKIWSKFVAWPEGITTWVIIFTLAAIMWQAIATQKSAKAGKNAAEASLLNAKALITAERPWIVLETRKQKGGDGFMFFVKNVGKTAAKITSIRNRVPFVTEKPEMLPETPEYPPEYEILKFPVLLPPGEERYIADFSFADFETKNPPRAYSIQVHMRSLYIYGRIQYSTMPEMAEADGSLWETRYCRWYVPMKIPAFIETRCPDGYNAYK